MIDGPVFVLIPAVVCIILYVSVGKSLWKQKTNVTRNRHLSILFMTLCLTWVLLCLPVKISEAIYGEYHLNQETMAKFMKSDYTMFVVMISHQTAYPLFSALNPLIFIACCKPTQYPFLSFMKKLFHRE